LVVRICIEALWLGRPCLADELVWCEAAEALEPSAEVVSGHEVVEVLPKHWIVERTIWWISRNRRLARDFERDCRIAAAFLRTAMIRIMLRRLAGKPSALILTSRMGSKIVF
jgi:hypothetical protein